MIKVITPIEKLWLDTKPQAQTEIKSETESEGHGAEFQAVLDAEVDALKKKEVV